MRKYIFIVIFLLFILWKLQKHVHTYKHKTILRSFIIWWDGSEKIITVYKTMIDRLVRNKLDRLSVSFIYHDNVIDLKLLKREKITGSLHVGTGLITHRYFTILHIHILYGHWSGTIPSRCTYIKLNTLSAWVGSENPHVVTLKTSPLDRYNYETLVKSYHTPLDFEQHWHLALTTTVTWKYCQPKHPRIKYSTRFLLIYTEITFRLRRVKNFLCLFVGALGSQSVIW